MDCLSTHQSESLVRYVAQDEGLDLDLGIKRLTLPVRSVELAIHSMRMRLKQQKSQTAKGLDRVLNILCRSDELPGSSCWLDGVYRL
jgi:hypothetical protein